MRFFILGAPFTRRRRVGTGSQSGDTVRSVAADSPTIRLGISSCLLGGEVRFDGGHKRDGFLVETVGPLVEWVPICPEVEMGLGTPREPIRLVRWDEGVRLVGVRSDTDHTEGMEEFARERVTELAREDLDGYILKKSSPSCGLLRVKTYTEEGNPADPDVGRFAAVLVEALPLLPVEEEGRLNDPTLRETFFERVFALHRFRREVLDDPSPRALVEFHARHKYVLLAHSPEAYSGLGRLVADAGREPLPELLDVYGRGLATALAEPATRGRHVNVLQHLLGFVSDEIDDHDRAELVAQIDDYGSGLVPLIVPVTLLRHHFGRGTGHAWARNQAYLEPSPRELMLRNHV